MPKKPSRIVKNTNASNIMIHLLFYLKEELL